MRTNNILIPTRFLVTIGHLIAIILVNGTKVRFVEREEEWNEHEAF